jgi:hypothetical protein
LISVLKALAIRSPVSFERGAEAETGVKAGIKTIGIRAKIKIKVRIKVKIKAAKSIFKDGFFLRLSARRVAVKKPRIRYYIIYIILFIKVLSPA